MTLDKDDAPPGCFAVEAAENEGYGDPCSKCCMKINQSFRCELLETRAFPCGPNLRLDKKLVHFEFHMGRATASWPCDDMGTPI